MSIEPWSIERPYASHDGAVDPARTDVRWLTGADGQRWSCRKVAELLIADGATSVRQVVACLPDNGGSPVHLRIDGDWSGWPESRLWEAIRKASRRGD